ncbi:MAG: hypothetical protein GXP33_09490 [Spirochaetes bacterium]|nr:hypothetical protein [Spirochaetota bacterium]
MKALIASFLKKRIRIEERLKEEIEIVLKLIDYLIKMRKNEKAENKLASVLEIEAEMENHYDSFLQSIDKKYYLPFYWEEIYDLYMKIKKVFSSLLLYFNRRHILEDTQIFDTFLTTEIKVLNNISLFFDEYISNRKYVQELLKNNGILIKQLSHMHLQIISNTIFESRDSLLKYRLVEVLENIAVTDRSIQDLLNKIFLTSAI